MIKRLKSSKFVRVKAFPMYGGISVSAPSLHRESTDSLIIETNTHGLLGGSCIMCISIIMNAAVHLPSLYNFHN